MSDALPEIPKTRQVHLTVTFAFAGENKAEDVELSYPAFGQVILSDDKEFDEMEKYEMTFDLPSGARPMRLEKLPAQINIDLNDAFVKVARAEYERLRDGKEGA